MSLYRILQQLRKDHAGVHTPDQRRFGSIDDALQRLLPYHVFQGAPPSQEEFSQGTAANSSALNLQERCIQKVNLYCVFTVDEEFEVVATQVLMRTHTMVNKYRRLLLVEAEVGSHTHT